MPAARVPLFIWHARCNLQWSTFSSEKAMHEDPADSIARKLFLWTVAYAVVFGFAVWLIMKGGTP